jgi:hypothetical protein
MLLLLCLGTPAAARQQPPPSAPPVDQSEGGGSSRGGPIRVGPAVFSGSVWLDGTRAADERSDEGPDPLEVRRARFGLAGTLSPRVGWTITGEFSGRPSLRNAFLVIRLAKQLAVRVGQANPISALERGSSPLRLELIDRSIVTTELTGPSDVGITVSNPEPFRGWFGYAVNVTNGTGFNRADNNGAKDVSGRLAVSPPSLPGVTVVVSGTRGRQPLGLRTRSGIGVDYQRSGWHLMAERLRQVRDNLPASHGYFLMTVYRPEPKGTTTQWSPLEVAGRFSVLHDHASAAGQPSGIPNDDGGPPAVSEPGLATTRELQLGVNYYVRSNMRAMFNVIVPADDRQASGPTFRARWQMLF